MTNIESPEENYCEIIDDTCPYEYPCSLCSLYREYEEAKEEAVKLRAAGKGVT